MAFTFKELLKKPNLENVFKYMGDNSNSAIVVAVAIATFKGIFRPIFTMTDKKSDPKTKKYTALREGLTEGIAVPVYIAVPMISEGLIVNTIFKKADAVTKKAVSANVKFLAVLASTAIIPAVCNLIQPKIMGAYQKSQDSKKALANPPAVSTIDKPSFSGNSLPPGGYNKINYGMRVGN